MQLHGIVATVSGKIRLWRGVTNYFEGYFTICEVCTIVLELLAWNFCKPSAISCNESRNGQMLKVSLISQKVFLVVSFPCSLSSITVFCAYSVLPAHSKHAFFHSLCVYLFYYLLCFCLPQGYVMLFLIWKNNEWLLVSTFWIFLFISLTLNLLYFSTIPNTISVIMSPLSEFFPYCMLFV